MAKKRKDGKKKRQTNLRAKARRDVNVAYRPEIQEIGRARSQAGREYGQEQERVSDIYAGLEDALAPLYNQYSNRAQEITGDLSTQLGTLAPLLQLAGGEGQAAQNYFGTLGATGQEMLASDRLRNLGYLSSTQRQAPLQAMADEKSMLQEYHDTLQDLRASKQDLVGRKPAEILAHLEELRATRRQNKIAQQELELRREIAEKQESRLSRGQRQEHQQNQNQLDFVQSEAERRRDTQKIKPIRSDLYSLLGRRENVRENLERAQSTVPYDISDQERLRAKNQRLGKRIRKKRKKIKRIRS